MTSMDLRQLIFTTATDTQERGAAVEFLSRPPELDVVAVTVASRRFVVWRWTEDDVSAKSHWVQCGDPIPSVDVSAWNEAMVRRFWEDQADVMQLAIMIRNSPPAPIDCDGPVLRRLHMPQHICEMENLITRVLPERSQDVPLWCDYINPASLWARGRFEFLPDATRARRSASAHAGCWVARLPLIGMVLQRVPEAPLPSEHTEE